MSAHIPVLLQEVLSMLEAARGGVFVDATFGAGGYTRGILSAAPCNRVIAFDRDPNAVPVAQEVAHKWPNRFSFIHDCFGEMARYVTQPVDGIVFDLGVSSMQIDKPERGFSFRSNGPLDMRMGQAGISAKEVVNEFDETRLADILYRFGEERAAYRIARALVRARQEKPIVTTAQLAEIIHHVMPRPKDGSDSAMRSFQAIRIFVNDELGELQRALEASPSLLKPGGRLVVVSFHSLEDRLVKSFMNLNGGLAARPNKYLPETISKPVLFQVLTKKPIVPTPAEVTHNPRAHSAKMRVAQRTKSALP